MAAALAYRGEFDRARALMEANHARACAIHDPTAEVAALVISGTNAQMQGAWERAVNFGRRALPMAQEIGNRIYEYNAHFVLGLALAHLGSLDEAIAMQERAVTLGTSARIRIVMGRVYGWLGEIYLIAGRLDDARDATERGRAISVAHGYLAEIALCDRVRGEVETAAGDYHAAAVFLDAARTGYLACDARPELARVNAALSRLAEAQGDTVKATVHARAALDAFTEMAMHWDAGQVASSK
ncbi:MAG: hypothetical protein LC748_13390 [Thermomicrobia bacterium]|nr:hypothetical protein [Thermomicrobia bacterium]